MTTPGAGPARRAIERRSAVVAVYLAGQRRALVAVVPLYLLVALFFVRGPVALLPGLPLLAAVGWLAYLSWPHLTPQPRGLRVAILAALALVVVLQVTR